MEPGLRRPLRNPERAGHLVERQPEVEMQDDDRTPFGLEHGQRAVDEITLDDAASAVADGRKVERIELHFDHPSPALARDVDAGVDGEAPQPGVEPVRVTKPRQVVPGAEHRILDCVLRQIAVPEDQAGGRVQAHDGDANERREGVVIAPLRPFDEVSLVHSRPSLRTALVVVLVENGERRVRNGSRRRNSVAVTPSGTFERRGRG